MPTRRIKAFPVKYVGFFLTPPLLKDDFRIIAPDMAGFGFPEWVSNPAYSMNNWVRQTLDLLDALKIEKTSLVGNSFGGALALSLAIKAPGRVNEPPQGKPCGILSCAFV
jgi:2-hydroxymuconate-semialdehyde hydrolase